MHWHRNGVQSSTVTGISLESSNALNVSDMKAYDAAHVVIKKKRIALGISDVDMANRSGLSIYEYGDIEQHADEIYEVVPLYHVKKLLSGLQLDPLATLRLGSEVLEGTAQVMTETHKPRPLIIAEARKRKGLERAELGEMIGFAEEEIAKLETYTAHLESWSIANVHRLASALGLSLEVLLEFETVQ